MIVMAIVLIVIALVIWAIRPRLVWELLGLPGFGTPSPRELITTWIHGSLAPMTPMGFVSLFTASDLGILGSLLVALCILLVLRLAQRRQHRAQSLFDKPIPLNRLPRLATRVRTAMVLIAVLGLELGWEIVAWRNWRQSEQYHERANRYAAEEDRERGRLEFFASELAGVGKGVSERRPCPWPKGNSTAAARAADTAYYRDQLNHEIAFLTDEVAALRELRRKYERAAQNPTRLLPPDPQLPKWPERPLYLEEWTGYADAQARFDDLIRRYPDLVRAHQFRALILAACPDPNLRDGQRAIAAATRAADLSDWKDPLVLSTLAAAYAEAGDFESAIQWEQRALEMFAAVGINQNPDDDRMSLYTAGKPFRMHGPRLHVGFDDRKGVVVDLEAS